jgi:hypothetical protein
MNLEDLKPGDPVVVVKSKKYKLLIHDKLDSGLTIGNNRLDFIKPAVFIVRHNVPKNKYLLCYMLQGVSYNSQDDYFPSGWYFQGETYNAFYYQDLDVISNYRICYKCKNLCLQKCNEENFNYSNLVFDKKIIQDFYSKIKV